MVLVGCRPEGRLTEQHDVFFGIGQSLKSLVPQVNSFWPEARGKWHVDSWREVTAVDGFRVEIGTEDAPAAATRLYFVNLGGYRPGDFEEYHYKMLAASPDMAGAVKRSKATAFYRHMGFNGAESHVDDKFGVDVDDLHLVEDLLPEKFSIRLYPDPELPDDALHIGYFPIKKLP
jgi:hypothetical protein